MRAGSSSTDLRTQPFDTPSPQRPSDIEFYKISGHSCSTPPAPQEAPERPERPSDKGGTREAREALGSGRNRVLQTSRHPSPERESDKGGIEFYRHPDTAV